MSLLENHGAIVVLRCPEKLDAAFAYALTEAFEQQFRAGQRFGCIVDTARVTQLPGPTERKLLAAWMNDPRVVERQRQLNVGSSTVVSNAAMRGVLTAIYWLWTPPTLQHAARDLDDALVWCLARLEAEKVPPGMPLAELKQRVVRADAAASRTMRA